MSQEESKIFTLKIIRNAQSGKEIASAMLDHFKKFGGRPIKTEAPDLSDALDILNAPLLAALKSS